MQSSAGLHGSSHIPQEHSPHLPGLPEAHHTPVIFPPSEEEFFFPLPQTQRLD